jgi:EAL domain-containing protein (putative c-di-GMP-specific phosphodiesterase class I)
MGRWLLAETSRQLARWIADGLQLWVGANVSVRELHRPDYRDQVADAVRTYRLPAGRLILEVTEHAFALDSEELVATLTDLRAAGVRIALDDFGAGLSSLGQLSNAPVDILRVNAAVIATAAASRKADVGPLADVVVRLGQRLGLDVIAVGVTDLRQRSVVTDAGCVLIQGDVIGPPMPAEHLEARLAGESVAAIPVPRRSNAGPSDAIHARRHRG